MFRRRPVLCSSGQIGEEGVRCIQHHQAEAVAHAGAELAGGVVAHETELVDCRLHPGVTSADTFSGRFNTLDTVPTETPARAATSLTLAETIPELLKVNVAGPEGLAERTELMTLGYPSRAHFEPFH